jgi:protein TonB
MLDQLVESKSHSVENTKRNSLLLGVMALAVVILAVSVYRSLTNLYNNLDLGSEGIELSTLVAPVPVEDEPPPKPQQDDKPKPQNVDVRKELIQNMMESPIKPPDKVSNEKLTIPPRRMDMPTVQGDTNSDNPFARQGEKVAQNTTGSGSGAGGTGEAPAPSTDEPPPPPKPKVPKTISGGVLNGKAVSLPKPAYPPAARAVRASGAVTVQVLIDEEGRVVSASATGGHPLLQAAAVAAARGARFSPTLLSGQPVKVSGIITYNFVP